MATKLLKYPKKPKATASADTIKNYFQRCKEVDRDNAKRKREDADKKKMQTKLRNFRPGKTRVSTGTRRKKASSKVAGTKRRKTAGTKRRRR